MISLNQINRSIHLLETIIKDPTLDEKSLAFQKSIKFLIDLLKNSSSSTALTQAIRCIQDLNPLIENVSQIATKQLSIRRKLHRTLELLAAPEIKPLVASTQDNYPALALFFDLDAMDHNGFVLGSLCAALSDKMAFITTRSILTGSKIMDLSKRNGMVQFVFDSISTNNWIILNREEFLVFVPSNQDIHTFDLEISGLKQIKLAQALSLPEKVATFETFLSLFQKEQSHAKLFSIAGHGGGSFMAGLSSAEYRQFLQFLKKQPCQGLTVSSCMAGGENTLMHEPSLSFPVIVRSIGDFVAYGRQKAEEHPRQFFDKFSQLLHSGKALTGSNLRTMVQEVENDQAKELLNLMQFLPPHSKGSPGGFRPVGEQENAYALTIAHLQAKKLQNKSILVRDKQLIELHPLVIKRSVVFSKRLPVLLSMIPGNAHHYIQKIVLDGDQTLELLLTSMQKFYKDGHMEVSKAFFIQELITIDRAWSQLVILYHANRMTCIYRENGKYFYNQNTISELQYTVLLDLWIKLSTPSDIAIQSQTGGQQGLHNFQEALFDGEFWIKSTNLLKKYTFLLQDLDAKPLEFFLRRLWFPTQDELKTLAFHFIQVGRYDLVQKMIETNKLSCDATNIDGVPLIVAAVQANALSLVKYLLLRGIDINTHHPLSGLSALHIAVKNSHCDMVQLLLENRSVDTEIKNHSGATPLFYALAHPPIYNALLAKSAGINVVDTQGRTPLSVACCKNASAAIQDLLKRKANPNIGSPLPLYWTLTQPDAQLTTLLLDHGANLYAQIDPINPPPIIEAILRSPPEIVDAIFARRDFNPYFTDNQENSILSATIQRGEPKYIKALIDRNVRLQYDLKNVDLILNINIGLNQLKAKGEIRLLKELLPYRIGCPLVEKHIRSLILASH